MDRSGSRSESSHHSRRRDRFTEDGRIVLLTTFRKQRNNERHEIDRARKAAADCALQNP